MRALTVLIIVIALAAIGPAAGLAQKGGAKAKPAARDKSKSGQNTNAPGGRGLVVSQIKSGTAPDGKGKLWAVLVGVSNYKNLRDEEQLRFAHRDAESLAAFLRSPEGGGFPSTQIKVLLNQEATVSALRTALGTWLARSAEAEDVVYVFFAGHGIVEGDEAYLLAHDSDPQNLYATSLSVSELNKIVNERVNARVKVMIADACHSGKIGYASRGAREEATINRYLDEVGKSAAGTFRLLASRENEKSYEDQKWGGGHGVFTHSLLEGLKGKADRDRDGVVRAGELLDYVSEVVPNETSALQHPRAAGNLDARLPLAIASINSSSDSMMARGATGAPTTAKLSLEVRAAAGSEVYLDNSYRGRVRPNGVLIIEDVTKGGHEISIDAPGAETIKQNISLDAAKTVIDLNGALPERASAASSPIVEKIKGAIAENKLIEQGGAFELYQQLVRESPGDPERKSVEIALAGALDEVGQQSINNYVQSSARQFKPDQLRRASQAYTMLKALKPDDQQVEAKRLFSAARVLLAEGKAKEAVALLEQSLAVDAKTACPYNALGVAHDAANEGEKALSYYKRAVELAPGWSLPRFRLGLAYYIRVKVDQAAREFEAAINLDPSFIIPRWWLAHSYRRLNKTAEAERELTELLRVAPDYAPAYNELGQIFEASKQHDKAAKAFNNYLRLVPAPAVNNSASGRGKE
jgi:uncharacterized caspase-like protein/tetratricopeptide (TPR) repeat protein